MDGQITIAFRIFQGHHLSPPEFHQKNGGGFPLGWGPWKIINPPQKAPFFCGYLLGISPFKGLQQWGVKQLGVFLSHPNAGCPGGTRGFPNSTVFRTGGVEGPPRWNVGKVGIRGVFAAGCRCCLQQVEGRSYSCLNLMLKANHWNLRYEISNEERNWG